MINYTFKIDTHDGKGLRVLPIKPFQGNSDIRILGEELDSGFMVLWLKNNENLPTMSYVEYTIQDENGSLTRKFYIGRDDVTNISKRKKYYQHNIELIELTKKLEKHLVGTLCFTQPTEIGKINYTLRSCIERIIRVFPLGIDRPTNDYRDTSTNINVYPKPENIIVHDIETDLSSFLDRIPAPQFVFNNPTLREAIDGVLKYVNAVAKLDTYYNMPNVTTVHNKIGAEFYGYLKKLIEIEKIYHKNVSQTIEDYSTNLKTYAQNVTNENFNENGQYIQYPQEYSLNTVSDNFYFDETKRVERIKSNDSNYEVSDSNCGILTQYPIKSVLSLQILVRIEAMRYENGVMKGNVKLDHFGINSTNSVVFLDVSKQVIEEEQFEKLQDNEKINYFYYKKNTNFINCSTSFKGVIFERTSQYYVLPNAVVDFLNRFSTRNEQVDEDNRITYIFSILLSDQNGNFGGIINLNDYELTVNVVENGKYELVSIKDKTGTNNFYRDARYRISYVATNDTLINSENENINDVNFYSESIMQQQDRIISFTNFTNTLYSFSQRTGSKDLEVTCKHFNVSDILDIGCYTKDNYVCTKAEYIYYNNFIIGKYIFDRNYNRISSYIGLNSEIRQFDLPTGNQTYYRNCEINNYVEIGRENLIDENSQNIFDKTLKYELLSTIGSLNSKVEGEKIYEYEYSPIRNAVITYNSKYTYNEEINNYFKRLSGYENPGLLLECFPKGTKNVLSFDFGFKDNINAGEYVKIANEGIIIDSSTKFLKEKIPYCMPEGDKIGFLRNLNFYLINKNNNYSNEKEMLPLINTTNLGKINLNNVMVLKDPSEIIKFTYNLNFISVEEKITLGKWFFENNYIFKNVTEGVENANNITFDLYYSKNKYSKFDIDKITESLTSQMNWSNFSDVSPLTNGNAKDENSADFYIQFNQETMPTIPNNTKTIIIANGKDIVMTIAYDPLELDENGENEIYKPIYFNFRTKRSKIVYEY